MKRRCLLVVVPAVALVLISVPAEAKGRDPAKAVIRGPGLVEPIVIRGNMGFPPGDRYWAFALTMFGSSTDPSSDAPLIALGESLVRARALEAGLAYELVAARADLQAVVTAQRQNAPEPVVRTLTGWRRELVGAELLELFAGRRSLCIGPDGRVLVRS